MLTLILRYRLLMWWRTLQSRRGVARRSPAIAALFGAFIGFFLFSTTRAATRNAADPAGVLVDVFGLLAALVVFFGISVALTELFIASDIELLLTAPLPDRTLYGLKLLDSARAAAGVAALALCALAGWGTAEGAGISFYVAAVAATLLIALGTTLLDLCAVLLLARFVPPKRLRDGVLLVGSVLGALFFVAFEVTNARGGPKASSVSSLSGRFAATPAAWAGRGVAAAAHGDTAGVVGNLGALALLTLALALLGYVLFRRVFLAALDAVQQVGARHKPLRATRRTPKGGRGPALPLATALKEWRLTVRDVPYLSSLIPTLFYACAFPVILLVQTRHLTGTQQRFIELGALPVVALLAAYAPALAAVAREGHAFDVLRSSPVRARDVLVGKTLAVGAPVALLVALSGLALDVLHHAPPAMYAVALVGAVWFGMGCALTGVAIGAYNPNFEQPPSRRQSLTTGGCVLYLVVATLFAAGTFAFAAAAIAAITVHDAPLPAPALLALGVAVLAAGLICTCIAVAVGERRLAALLAPQE